MQEKLPPTMDLEAIARQNLGRIRRNLTTPALYEEIIRNREGILSHLGPIVVRTGHHTERSAEDKFIVREPSCEEKIWWSGRNKPLSEQHFNTLFYRLLAYLQNKDVYVQDCHAGSGPDHRIPLRIVSETAWHSLFARNLFHQIHDPDELKAFAPDFTVVCVPGFQSIPEVDGTRSSAFVIVHMALRVIFIGGTSYAGEIKHAVFTAASYLVSQEKALSLRCAANVGAKGDVAMFLGREGSGKTSLATDPERRLVADDHMGWSDGGLFSYEWGCYTKVMNLTDEKQPLIHECTRRFGTILENVSLDQGTRRVDLGDDGLTGNTRAAYPVSHIPNALREGACGHPSDLFILTRDPFGVLPPIARLTPEQAAFAFLTSYKPEAAGSEEPDREMRILNNACFGATPLIMMPQDYARLLMTRLVRHKVRCWLMNTGWSGEPEGRAERIRLAQSKAMVDAAVSRALDSVPYETDPIFQFEIPKECPGLPADLLSPRSRAADEGEYEVRANRMATDFMKDFKLFEKDMPESIREMLSKIVLLEESLDVIDKLDLNI